MKKLVFGLVMTLMMAVCSVCGASAGKVLDAEMALVDKFLAANDYKAVTSLLTADYQKDFNAESFANYKKVTTENFGALSSKTLRSVTKFDDADMLEYQASFAKIPTAVYVFAFAVNDEKPLIRDFSIQLPKPKDAPAQAAPAEGGNQ